MSLAITVCLASLALSFFYYFEFFSQTAAQIYFIFCVGVPWVKFVKIGVLLLFYMKLWVFLCNFWPILKKSSIKPLPRLPSACSFIGLVVSVSVSHMVLYPGPGFLSSATWPSLPKKHYNELVNHYFEPPQVDLMVSLSVCGRLWVLSGSYQRPSQKWYRLTPCVMVGVWQWSLTV